MVSRFRLTRACVIAAFLWLPSCGSDKSSDRLADAGAPDAAKEPIVGDKLSAAIASAAAASTAKPKAKTQDANQPPENGIFPPGEADKRQPRDAPPKLDLLGDGSEPRVALALRPDLPEQKVVLTVGLRIGQAARLPTANLSLSLKAEKPSAEAATEPAAGAAPIRMVATVTDAAVPANEAVQKPVADAIGKLKGTAVRFSVTPGGAASGFAVELPKDAGKDLDPQVGALHELVPASMMEALSAMIAPLPAKPVGKDAYWIVSDRAKTAVGVEAVRYRVFKVVGVDGDAVTMSIDIRQYSADEKLNLDAGDGSKTEMAMQAFESRGKGTIVWRPDGALPARADVTSQVGAKLSAGGRGSALVQTELTGTLRGPSAAGSAAPSSSK